MQVTAPQSLAIQAHARSEYPKECCGVILSGGDYAPLINQHESPETHFRIGSEYLERLDYVAIVHSHPDGLDAPSAADMAGQRASGVPWVIVKVTEQGCKKPFVLGGKPEPLIGRRFRHGVNDCYSLIQDWLEAQGQRHLTPEVPRDWEWWLKSQSLYMDHYQAAGWERTSSPEVGCVGLIQTAGSPVFNHGGVLIPDGWFLHHQTYQLSKRERVEQWTKSIQVWLRHPGFTLADL